MAQRIPVELLRTRSSLAARAMSSDEGLSTLDEDPPTTSDEAMFRIIIFSVALAICVICIILVLVSNMFSKTAVTTVVSILSVASAISLGIILYNRRYLHK